MVSLSSLQSAHLSPPIPCAPCLNNLSIVLIFPWSKNHKCNCARGGAIFLQANLPSSKEWSIDSIWWLTCKINLETIKEDALSKAHTLTSLELSLILQRIKTCRRSPTKSSSQEKNFLLHWNFHVHSPHSHSPKFATTSSFWVDKPNSLGNITIRLSSPTQKSTHNLSCAPFPTLTRIPFLTTSCVSLLKFSKLAIWHQRLLIFV